MPAKAGIQWFTLDFWTPAFAGVTCFRLWRMIIATRNRIIHGYLGIDNDTLWSIIQDDVTELLLRLKELRHSL